MTAGVVDVEDAAAVAAAEARERDTPEVCVVYPGNWNGRGERW